jgi:trimeric autotransporter adhesin
MQNKFRSTRNRLSSLAATVALLLATSQWALAQGNNTAIGQDVLSVNQGSDNSGFGDSALKSNTTGYHNTAIGSQALSQNTIGLLNSAFGSGALWGNTSGSTNVAIGVAALANNTFGSSNTATGASALVYNSTGNSNTASGVDSLFSNRTGDLNTATGYRSLYKNVDGFLNTASGSDALYSNTSGYYNVADGAQSLYSNSTGIQNTATGYQSLLLNTTGDNNTASGYQSLSGNQTGWGNTGIGFQALGGMMSGHNNVALGYKAGLSLTGDNNIAILNSGVAGENNVTRIGQGQSKAFIAGISGVKVSGGVQVFINANGQLGTLTSSQRFKDNIKTIDADSEKLQQLRPVSFLYKDSAESGKHTLQYGLIAEEVAKVYPELVQYDEDGKPFTVYYHLLTPLLLREAQKDHSTLVIQQKLLDQQKEKIKNQENEIANLRAELEIQKHNVTAILENQKIQLAQLAALSEKMNLSDSTAPTTVNLATQNQLSNVGALLATSAK